MSDPVAKAEPKAAAPSGGAKARGRSAEALERFHGEEKLQTGVDLRLLRRVWGFVRPHRSLLVVSTSFLVITSVLAVARPLLMREAFDGMGDGTPEQAVRHLMKVAFTMAGFLFVEQLLSFPQMYSVQMAGARAMADLRMAVFEFLHTRKLGFFDRQPVGRLVTRVTNDVDSINEMFASGALNAIGDCLKLVGIVSIMVSLDWKMSLLAFAAVPPVYVGVGFTRKRMREAFRAVRSTTARMNGYLNEQVSGMAVVQAYAREERNAHEFDEINLAYRDANNRSIVLDATLDAAIEMVSSVCIAAVLWYSGVQAHSKSVSFGTLVAFVAYIEMFFGPIRDLSQRYTLVQSAMSGAERVFQLLDNKDADGEIAPSSSPPAFEPVAGAPAFEFEGVTFAYKTGTPVLADVSLRGEVGDQIALVGATGAGKSTVASLLLRLYEVDSGTIRVFGRDARAIDARSLRRLFAVVPQDVFLFPGTLASNIAAGEPDVDMARVERALDRIDARDLFERREGGLEAPVFERGANFSAGERQLVAFARALYRDPPVLVLDEATASVDSETESRLQRALVGAMTGRTSLIIAHRLSTIRAANRIVVFHRGHVAEQGTHDELLRAGGIYARLHELQFARERLEADEVDGARSIGSTAAAAQPS